MERSVEDCLHSGGSSTGHTNKHWDFWESSTKTDKVPFWLAGQASCMEHVHQILREDLNNWCNCVRFVLSSPSMSKSSMMCLCDGNVRGHSLSFLLWPRNQTAVLLVKKPVPSARARTHTHTHTHARARVHFLDPKICQRTAGYETSHTSTIDKNKFKLQLTTHTKSISTTYTTMSEHIYAKSH